MGDFLKEQLKDSKRKAAKEEKHTQRVSGYNLFFKHLHSSDKSIDFKQAGEQWKAMTDAQRAEWNNKAASANATARQAAPVQAVAAPADQAAPALVAPESQSESASVVTSTSTQSAPPQKKAQKKPAPVEGEPSSEAPQKKKEKKEGDPKVSLDKTTRKWMVVGTNYYVSSPQQKVIIGKMIEGVDTPLNGDDLQMCAKNGWSSMKKEAV